MVLEYFPNIIWNYLVFWWINVAIFSTIYLLGAAYSVFNF